MKLTVKKFGPIKEAVIDLDKNLIIISGQNNTGKTFITTLIYSLYKNRYNVLHTKLPEIDRTFEENQLIVEVDVIDYFELNKDKFSKEITSALLQRLPENFSVDESEFKETQIEINFDKVFNNLAKKIALNETRLYQNDDKVDVQIEIRKELSSPLVAFYVEQADENLDFLDDFMRGILSDISCEILFNNVFFVPAERQGINLFSKELTTLRRRAFDDLLKLDNNGSMKLITSIRKNVNRYSIPIIDNINFIEEEIDFVVTKKKTFLTETVKKFEKHVLDGHISISQEGDLKFSTNGVEIGINSMSSTVKSLASFTYYLKHIAQPNDFIIIDEPELNLHPDNQLKVIRFIAYLVNNGIKILLSTHSEYMIRELNNLILLNTALLKSPEEIKHRLKKYRYTQSELLNYKHLAVYLFQKRKNVKSQKVDETGFEIETIDKVVDQINSVSNDVYFNLF